MNVQQYNISLPQLSMPKVETWAMDSFYEPIHSHSEFQITLIQKGRGSLFVSDNVVDFKEGDLYFFGSNLPHALKVSDINKKGETLQHCKAINLFFDQNKIKESLRSLPEASRINRLIDYSNYGIKISKKDAKHLTGYVKKLAKMKGLEKFLFFLKFLNAVSKNEKTAVLSLKAIPKPMVGEGDPKVRKIYDFIKANYKEEITLKAISNTANMSPTGFCRFFKAKSGKTFSQYLTEVRIGNACELLHNNDHNIFDCCYGSGFNNLSNFHKHFKKHTGMSPHEYRHKINNKIEIC
ncbi:AraC family transcriptional regulator [Flavivirga aquimarina]|uniref:AraC family transcriptional regulator n=1 Tax=Flavivirga aquimarina TaxID=2027862 RepID=A0ABT8W6M4_9FLAO|nr:AraC family transcriptional regulator [Flavivirga aquimarina]MDO5968724.1 AraC family transcriptional regulator [Flavivirga aquimarina]